ncbi:MAG: ATP-binding protein [Bacilli bacterium]|nr:ATP-binding protein [Bacilli bacterium]
MKKLIRETYLSKLRPFYNDCETIKVLTGVRRSGKSTIMSQVRDELEKQGISKEQLIYINLDQMPYKAVKLPNQLEKVINKKIDVISEKKFCYLFLDEIQNVKNFEVLINSYREEGNISIFITGSNSYMLSGELITKLTGRYIEVQVNTLTYQESRDLLKINKQDIPNDFFENYLRWGGFPKRFEYDNDEARLLYLSSTIDEILSKDILKQAKIRNKPLMKKCIDFVASTPALTISTSSIKNYLLHDGEKTKKETINRYLNFIFDSKIADRLDRYDLKGKVALKTFYKAYLSDLSFKTLVSSNPKTLDYGPLLETIVYHELISRGYSLSIGKYDSSEIDFVVRKGDRLAYIQVCYYMGEKGSKTYEREIQPLQNIKDNYPKFIISMDPLGGGEQGIQRLRLIDDFLLGDRFSL